MKKIYSKPELYFENFALMECIASCNTAVGHTENTCAYTDPNLGLTIFSNADICSYTGECYDLPDPTLGLFPSM